MADLSKVSTEDLLAYKAGKFSEISDEGLLAIKAARAGTTQSPKDDRSSTANLMAKDAQTLYSGAMGATSGLTLGLAPRVATEVGAVGSWLALEGAEAVSGGKYKAPTYKELRKIGEKTYYGLQDEARSAAPLAYGAGEFTGLVSSGGALAKGAEKLAAKGLEAMPKVQSALANAAKTRGGAFFAGKGGAISKATATGLKLGGAAVPEGVIYGFGQEQDLSKAGDKGIQTGALSALGGGAFGAAGSLAKSALKPIIPIIGEKIAAAKGRVRLEGSEESRRVYNALSQSMTPEEINLAIEKGRKSKEPLAISMQNELQGFSQATANAPAARKFAEGYFKEKKALVSKNLEKSLSENIFAPINSKTFIDDIVVKGREKATPLYEKAYEMPIKINKDLEKIIETDVFKKALSEAQQIEEISAAASGGEVMSFKIQDGEAPTKAFDMVLRGIDELAFKEAEVSGLKSAKVRELKNLRRTLSGLITEQNPVLAEARKVSSDYITAQDSFELGKQFMNMDADILREEYKRLSPQNRSIMTAAIANELRSTSLSKMAKGIDGVQGLSDAIGEKKLILGKLKSILPEKNYKKFESALNEEVSMIRLSNTLLSGSQTQLRQVSDRWARSGGNDLANQISEKGLMSVPQEAVSKVIGLYSGDIPKDMTHKIAEAIFSQDPKVQKKFLLDLRRQSNANIRRDATKAFIELRSAALQGSYDKGIEAITRGAVVPMAEGL